MGLLTIQWRRKDTEVPVCLPLRLSAIFWIFIDIYIFLSDCILLNLLWMRVLIFQCRLFTVAVNVAIYDWLRLWRHILHVCDVISCMCVTSYLKYTWNHIWEVCDVISEVLRTSYLRGEWRHYLRCVWHQIWDVCDVKSEMCVTSYLRCVWRHRVCAVATISHSYHWYNSVTSNDMMTSHIATRRSHSLSFWRESFAITTLLLIRRFYDVIAMIVMSLHFYYGVIAAATFLSLRQHRYDVASIMTSRVCTLWSHYEPVCAPYDLHIVFVMSHIFLWIVVPELIEYKIISLNYDSAFSSMLWLIGDLW